MDDQQQPAFETCAGRAEPVSPTTTSRVPGVTRNSGWRAVDAMIVESRALRQQQTETSTEAESRAKGWTPQHYRT